MLKVTTPTRGTDPGGSGGFGASRGNRTHKGIDYAAAPDSVLHSPVEGRVTKLGYPYGDDLSYRYVQIEDADGNRHRFFYVQPYVGLSEYVTLGGIIGKVQDVSVRYPIPKGMKCHVHYEIMDEYGYLNPEQFHGLA